MNYQNLENKLLNILYNAQINNIRNPKELDDIEEEIGEVMMNELVNNLHNKDLTNLTSKKGGDNHCFVSITEPLLTASGLKYVEYLRKPWWKKINIRHIIYVACFCILSAILYFIVNILPNLDKILENTQNYILKF